MGETSQPGSPAPDSGAAAEPWAPVTSGAWWAPSGPPRPPIDPSPLPPPAPSVPSSSPPTYGQSPVPPVPPVPAPAPAPAPTVGGPGDGQPRPSSYLRRTYEGPEYGRPEYARQEHGHPGYGRPEYGPSPGGRSATGRSTPAEPWQRSAAPVQSPWGTPPRTGAYTPPQGWRPPPGPPRGWEPPPAVPRPRRLHPLAWAALAFGLTVLLVAGVGIVALVSQGRLLDPGASAGVAAGSGAAPPPSEAVVDSPDDRRIAGIEASLTAMTEGLRTRDEARFLSVVAGGSTAVTTRQRAVFRSLITLPLQDPEYAWAGDALVDAVAPAVEGAVDVTLEFRYRLRGYDSLTAHDPLALTFAPSGDRWLVVGDTVEPRDQPVGPYAEPWASGSRLTVEQRPHVLVVGDASRRTDLKRLATNLEKVIGDVRRIWPEPSWNGKVIAYAATDRRFVAEWFGDQAADGKRDAPDADPSFEARVVSLPGAPTDGVGDGERGPTRLVVTPYLLRQSDSYSTSVLRHEVTHVATDHMGRYPPAWLLEGAAEYTGFRLGGTRVDAERTFGRHGVPTATARAMQKGTWRPVLVNDSRVFYQGTSKAVEAAYNDGWIAALYVADTYGDATLRRLYQVAASQPETADWDEVDAVALRTVLKTDHDTFTSAVRVYGTKLRKKFA